MVVVGGGVGVGVLPGKEVLCLNVTSMNLRPSV